ncbi:MAG: hypothetical protein HY070_01275 [Chloroflexi bacterium]|nr:hypothetical protein [Chloroflexota bacterium]MBI3741787.1 hypothetical protein [Chloroflexota bacterium]
MGKRGPAPKRRVIEWDSSLAYAVGLLVTDGNLSPDGRHIDFTSKDRELVEMFKNCLSLDNRIGLKFGGFGKPTVVHRVQFSDVGLYQWLLRIGVTPNKSKVIGALDIPVEYFFDFLRGHLDGDGTTRKYPDPVYPKAQRLYVSFISASRPHLEWLQSRIKELLGLTGFLQERSRSFELTYAKQESILLLRVMYYSTDIPCLERKRRIVKEFLTSDW